MIDDPQLENIWFNQLKVDFLLSDCDTFLDYLFEVQERVEYQIRRGQEEGKKNESYLYFVRDLISSCLGEDEEE